MQRVAIALALAGGPRLLIADEPTTGLDAITQRQVRLGHERQGRRVTDVFTRLGSFGERFRLEQGLAPGEGWIACDRLLDPRSEELVEWVLDDHLLPLAQAMRVRTRARLRQLYGGVAHGCAAAFCIASGCGGDVDQLETAYKAFVAASTIDLNCLGKVVRLTEDDRAGLFYLRNTCCLYYTSAAETKCSSCWLGTVNHRIANYRRVLAKGVVPH